MTVPAPLVFALPGNEAAAERLAGALGGEVGVLTMHEFPDDETYVRVDTDPASRDVVIVATLWHPNPMLPALLFLADAVRDLGASRAGLVAPYLAYMRQDARFRPGEAITSRSFASLVSRSVDWLVTVDPHLHRVASLSELYTIPATAVHVAAELGAWIAANVPAPFVIGPDAESRQWVDRIAAAAHAPSTVLAKSRRGDTDVVESIPHVEDHRSCTPVLVDDIISTGRTMIAAVDHLREQGTAAPVCVAVHAVFAGSSFADLTRAGASRVATTNTIAHPSNVVDVIPAITDAVRRHLTPTT
jgi:ribose-phosphate pyrophosphokinase